jgi:hypothetical protein
VFHARLLVLFGVLVKLPTIVVVDIVVETVFGAQASSCITTSY